MIYNKNVSVPFNFDYLFCRTISLNQKLKLFLLLIKKITKKNLLSLFFLITHLIQKFLATWCEYA